MNCCPWIRRGSYPSWAIHPEETSFLQECPICYENISRDTLVYCANPTHPHPHHVQCILDYSNQVSLGEVVECSQRCGHVFENILGRKVLGSEHSDAGPEVQLDWTTLQPRIDAAMASGALRLSRSSRFQWPVDESGS